MAGTYIEDTLEGASLEATPISARRTKGGLVKDIDTLGNPDPVVLDKALSVVLASHPWGEVYPSGDPGEKAFLGKIFVYPITAHMCRIQLVYEVNAFPVQSSYLIRDTGYLQGWNGNILPGTGDMIGTAWEEPTPASPPAGWTPAKVRFDLIPSSFSMPVRGIGIVAVIFGAPPVGLTSYNGYVNNFFWHGLPKGYWRIDRIESETIGFGGYYTYSANVFTRQYKDWSETGTLRNQQNGRYVTLDQAELDELLGRTYSYGVMQGGTGARAGKAGCVRTCPHPEANLTAIMGF